MFKIFKTFSKTKEPVVKPEEKSVQKSTAPVKSAPQKTVVATKQAPTKSPEELCAVDEKMSKDDIRVRLASLYKRYNRATSSLDAKLRAESEVMLDAIVNVREKHFGPI